MGALSPTHWAIIAVLVVLLFGSKRLPDVARGLGQSLRILRAETRATDAPATGAAGSGHPVDEGHPATGGQPAGTTAPRPGPGEPGAEQHGAGTGTPA